MTIMGINFTKMNVEKKEGKKGKVNISNNVGLNSVEKVDLNVGGDNQESLKFGFAFSSTYDPEIGKIELEGNVVYMTSKDEAKSILDEWEKNQKVDKATTEKVLPSVLNKCNTEALLLSKEINLPSPIPLPKLKK
ncbi:MAG: hypothetical protein ACQEP1_02555 [Nanobdellota archaeon]